jgi:VanZ family protein
MRPDRLPAPLRAAIFAAAVAGVLYVSLSPAETLPGTGMSDKIEHALAWAALTGLGLALAPRRWRVVAGFCLLLGIGVEIAQATMGLGRQGDWRDMVADAVGVLIAIRLAQAVQRLARPRAVAQES